jgi:hypothetical protein
MGHPVLCTIAPFFFTTITVKVPFIANWRPLFIKLHILIRERKTNKSRQLATNYVQNVSQLCRKTGPKITILNTLQRTKMMYNTILDFRKQHQQTNKVLY